MDTKFPVRLEAKGEHKRNTLRVAGSLLEWSPLRQCSQPSVLPGVHK